MQSEGIKREASNKNRLHHPRYERPRRVSSAHVDLAWEVRILELSPAGEAKSTLTTGTAEPQAQLTSSQNLGFGNTPAEPHKMTAGLVKPRTLERPATDSHTHPTPGPTIIDGGRRQRLKCSEDAEPEETEREEERVCVKGRRMCDRRRPSELVRLYGTQLNQSGCFSQASQRHVTPCIVCR